MNKKILVVYYSQTGQLKDIVTRFTIPFVEKGHSVVIKTINIAESYHFPWTNKRFFNVMPESVLGIPSKINELNIENTAYDLVVIAYQPWFLSPSIPVTSLLNNPEFKKIIHGKPVLTLIGARNMWIMAQEDVKILLSKAGANLVGNVALKDRNSNLLSAITILHWMFNGKKDKFLGIFPKPGVSDEDIKNANIFGELVVNKLSSNDFSTLQNDLIKAGAVEIDSNLMFIEPRAKRLFNIWANIISKKKNRTLWLKFFNYYLVFALFLVSPIVLTLNAVLLRPFSLKKIEKSKKYYLGVTYN